MWGDWQAQRGPIAVDALYDFRNWGLSLSVRWYPAKFGRLPVVVSAQLGPFAGALYLGCR